MKVTNNIINENLNIRSINCGIICVPKLNNKSFDLKNLNNNCKTQASTSGFNFYWINTYDLFNKYKSYGICNNTAGSTYFFDCQKQKSLKAQYGNNYKLNQMENSICVCIDRELIDNNNSYQYIGEYKYKLYLKDNYKKFDEFVVELDFNECDYLFAITCLTRELNAIKEFKVEIEDN